MLRGKTKLKNNHVHVRTGDQVVVISGDNKGKKGKVLDVIPSKNQVIVEGVNQVKHHTKPSAKLGKGGILEKEGAIAASRLALFNAELGDVTQARIQTQKDGKRVRVCKKSKEPIGK